MGRKAISYEAFKAAWTDLEAQGKATIPNARSVVGGSNPTLMKYRDRLRAEQDESELAAFDLPATLKQVIHAFASERCKVVETQKADLLADIAEYQKALDENATETQQKAESWAKAAQRYEERILRLEKALSASEARIEDAAQREKTLQSEITQLRMQHHEAELEMVAFKTQNQAFEKRVEALEAALQASRKK